MVPIPKEKEEMMDFGNLEAGFCELVEHMESNGYSAEYVRKVKTEFNWIMGHAEGNEWISYADVCRERLRSTRSPGYARTVRNSLAIIARFDLGGILPDGAKRVSPIEPRGAYHKLNGVYRVLVDGYRESAAASGKKASTIDQEASNASCFLLAMQGRGCGSLAEVTESDADSFFLGTDGRPGKSCSYRKSISAVLKSQAGRDPECARVLLCLPGLREKRKAIQYLSDGECAAIADALADADSGLSLRDRAIGQLLLRTGMRGCDIAAMTTESVGWAAGAIRIDQQKTGVPLILPLTAAVGNAIYDYVSVERPRTQSPWLFLTESRPVTKLAASSVGNVAAKLFKAAGIRQGAGDRCGTHVFRHHAATAMLAGGVPRPVISRTLGHASPASLHPYLSADVAHLRECALDVGCFPVGEGVLAQC